MVRKQPISTSTGSAINEQKNNACHNMGSRVKCIQIVLFNKKFHYFQPSKTPETKWTLIDTRKSRAVLRCQISIVQLTRLYIKKTGPSSLLRHVGPIQRPPCSSYLYFNIKSGICQTLHLRYPAEKALKNLLSIDEYAASIFMPTASSLYQA